MASANATTQGGPAAQLVANAHTQEYPEKEWGHSATPTAYEQASPRSSRRELEAEAEEQNDAVSPLPRSNTGQEGGVDVARAKAEFSALNRQLSRQSQAARDSGDAEKSVCFACMCIDPRVLNAFLLLG
jgi:hypothetical protein